MAPHTRLLQWSCALSLVAAGCPNAPVVTRNEDLRPIELADLLFVVDNSASMRQEQAALRAQFPKLIRALTTGRKDNGETFPHLRDIHFGVVSTDMGLVGVPNNYPGCNTQRHFEGGDDGVLQHPGSTGPDCQAEYPQFLSYDEDADDPERVAADFGCIAALGTQGCAFEQPLEAALKALWPKDQSHQLPPIAFLGGDQHGHGDRANAGFVRGPAEGRSLLAIVVVTDEEDCSTSDPSIFGSSNDPNDPLSSQPINLRCFHNKQRLFELGRYVFRFRALRPDLVFAAVVGVPVDLVGPERRDVDFGDPGARDAYYERILNDPRMQERVQGDAIVKIAPSCERMDENGERAEAYPPRRIVELAKRMGPNAIVQSICQDDFGPAFDELIDLIAAQMI